MSDSAFALENVSVQIGSKRLLHPMTLAFTKGRITGLIGHNGSGKSTLLKLLARQMRPASGTVHYDARPLSAYGSRDFARRVAYLPQQTAITDGLTVRELVALGRYPWHGALGRFSSRDRDCVEDALSRTRLDDLAGRIVETLSGGERQRAMVAMLVAQDSECLLLDEPISALDIANQIEVMALIRSCAEDHGKTVIVVLHDINIAARYCDDIVALHGGRLIAREPAVQVMDTARLEAIYGVRMGIFTHPESHAPVSYVL